MSVFLILYLWHGFDKGGPSLVVAPMPSVAACEQVGREAKAMADQEIDGKRSMWSPGPHQGLTAIYRCIQVPK